MTPDLTPLKEKPEKKYNKDLIKFNLKSYKDENVKTQIFLIFSFKGKRLRYYTGKRIEPKYWLTEKQKAKSSYENAITLNRFLRTTANFLETKYNDLVILEEKVTVERLKNELNNRFNSIDNEDFFARFDEYFEASKNHKTNGTIIRQRTTYNRLIEYCEKKNFKISFDAIDYSFEERFRDYLINVSNHTNNTIAKHFKTLKAFLNWATEREYNKNLTYQKFKTKEEDGEVYFLSWDELTKLFTLEIKNPKLERVRDIFCFGCFTGLRFSDILNLKQDNISNDTIKTQTIKTGSTTIIPLNKYSRMIYEKYKTEKKYMLFQKISNQKMNKYLKELGELAEIKEPVQIVRYRGAERIEKIVPKYEVLTSHVARKTFITNAMIRGMSTEVIMDITTHNSYKSFKRYFKIVDEHKRSQMNKAFE